MSFAGRPGYVSFGDAQTEHSVRKREMPISTVDRLSLLDFVLLCALYKSPAWYPLSCVRTVFFFFFFPSLGLSILCFRTIISMQSAATLFCFYSYCHMRLYISPLSFLASMLPHIFHRATHFKLHSLLLQSRNGPALRSQEINAPIS